MFEVMMVCISTFLQTALGTSTSLHMTDESHAAMYTGCIANETFAAASITGATLQLLMHRRACHFGHETLQRTAKQQMATGFEYSHRHSIFCEICPLGNSKNAHLHRGRQPTLQPLERVHVDLWGKCSFKSLQGNYYIIGFIDDFSRYATVYFIKRKEDAHMALKRYVAEHATPLGAKILELQTDGGTEFKGEFEATCRVQGIKMQ